jgi:hypothetical protein
MLRVAHARRAKVEDEVGKVDAGVVGAHENEHENVCSEHVCVCVCVCMDVRGYVCEWRISSL